jgi:hypothetical protein
MMGNSTDIVSAKPIRLSVSIPADAHIELERRARQKKVSMAWVVREAVQRYLEAETPLFRQTYRGDGQNLGG